MVKDNVQDDFDPVLVELADEFFQLGSFTVVLGLGSVAGVWRKEINGIVSPVFKETFAIYSTGIHVLIELEDRHELYSVDSQFFQIRDLFFEACKSSRMCDTGRRILCKSANMKFVDDKITDLAWGLRHIFPVKSITYNTGMIASDLLLTPFTLACNSLGIRIEKNFCLIENMTFFRFIRTVNMISILQILDVQPHDDHGIDITDTTGVRKRKNCERLLFTGVEKKKFAGCTVTGMCGKVNSVGKRSSTI